MKKYLPHILAALAVVFTATAAQANLDVPKAAFAEGAVDQGEPRVETRLITDVAQVTPGESFRVGVLFTLDPAWHVYWRNSGDAGVPTKVDFAAEQADFGPLQWPAPQVYVQPAGEITTFGWGEEVVLFAQATADAAAEGEITVRADVSYLACKIDCVPGKATLERTIPVGTHTALADPLVVGLFDEFAQAVPRSPDDLGVGVDVALDPPKVRPGEAFTGVIGLDWCAGEDCLDATVTHDEGEARWAFIPDNSAQAGLEVAAIVDHPSAEQGQALVLKGQAKPNPPRDDERLSGVIHLNRPGADPVALRIDAPFPRAPAGATVGMAQSPLLSAATDGAPATADDAAAAADAEAELHARQAPKPGPEPVPWWQALLLAFVGGLILNLMPCVFPVLAVKVTAFARLVHEERRHVLSHGAAYTGGIVGTMLALAGVVLGLRAAGTEVGWGFQFQSPIFIAVLIGIVFLFALNLFGVFQVGVRATELAEKAEETSGLRRSFAEGILAVVLATPCSAPFLGTAVGFALASSATTILAVFTALGLGLAAPFVLLTLVPGWARLLPRPGAWMDVLKQLLGFALVGTAIWLAWVLGQMTGAQGVIQVLILTAAVAFAAWLFGRYQYRWEGVRKWGTTLLLASAVIGVGVPTLRFEAADAAPAAAADSASVENGELQWRAWTEADVQAELDKGRIVFVDFTADWCITCKVNERTVLNTPTVIGAIEKHDVALFKADWTNPDERIRKKLAEFGKAGIPLYLVYSPDAPNDPQVLPEVITPELVAEAFDEAR